MGTMTIKEAAKRLQVEAYVLRYWEDELKLDIKRNEQGHRYYDERDIRMFEGVKKMKEEGLTLKDIRNAIMRAKCPDNKNQNGGRLNDFKNENQVEYTNKEQNKYMNREQVEYENQKQSKDKNQEVYTNQKQSKNQEAYTNQKQNKYKDQDYRNSSGDNHPNMDDNGTDWNYTIKYTQPEKKIIPAEMADEGDSMIERMERAVAEGEKVVDFKQAQLQAVMNKVIATALRENKEIITSSIKQQVTADVMRQFDTVMREQEEREEARYHRLDTMLKEIQRGNEEAAATRTRKRFWKRKG